MYSFPLDSVTYLVIEIRRAAVRSFEGKGRETGRKKGMYGIFKQKTYKSSTQILDT